VGEGFNAPQDEAVSEIVAAFQPDSGMEVELVLRGK
jgi:hypothetical protein